MLTPEQERQLDTIIEENKTFECPCGKLFIAAWKVRDTLESDRKICDACAELAEIERGNA